MVELQASVKNLFDRFLCGSLDVSLPFFRGSVSVLVRFSRDDILYSERSVNAVAPTPVKARAELLWSALEELVTRVCSWDDLTLKLVLGFSNCHEIESRVCARTQHDLHALSFVSRLFLIPQRSTFRCDSFVG